jgi:hypothetical protein
MACSGGEYFAWDYIDGLLVRTCIDRIGNLLYVIQASRMDRSRRTNSKATKASSCFIIERNRMGRMELAVRPDALTMAEAVVCGS